MVLHALQMRSFEVMIARVGNDEGQEVVFSSMPAEADRQVRQLHHVLRRLGATASTPVTILSDGADGPRSLAWAASVGPARHVLDWFHLAMRVQHVAQAGKGWVTAVPAATELPTALAAFIHQGGERSGRRVEMINVGLYGRASSAAALTAA